MKSKSRVSQEKCQVHWIYGSLSLVLAFFLVGLLYLVNFDYYVPVEAVGNTSIPQAAQKIGVPVYVQIPSIQVAAIIEPVGITPEGAMDVPQDPNDVAWYKFGPKPGEKGSAVIDGHLDGEQGLTAVFKDLDKVVVGGTVEIKDESNKILKFVIRDKKLYDVGADTTAIFKKDDGIYLNIITCAGEWDKQAHDYTKRLVVFTELVP